VIVTSLWSQTGHQMALRTHGSVENDPQEKNVATVPYTLAVAPATGECENAN